jgi:hypothetical protein
MRKKQVLKAPESESMTRAEQFLSNTEDKL